MLILIGTNNLSVVGPSIYNNWTMYVRICLMKDNTCTKMGMFGAYSNFSLHYALLVTLPYSRTSVAVAAMCTSLC